VAAGPKIITARLSEERAKETSHGLCKNSNEHPAKKASQHQRNGNTPLGSPLLLLGQRAQLISVPLLQRSSKRSTEGRPDADSRSGVCEDQPERGANGQAKAEANSQPIALRMSCFIRIHF
jgi:hypothetical protein